LLYGINILVAEDNLINQKIANYILTKQRASVFSVMNGKEAIDFLRNNQVDIILMDLQMPGIDGFEAARIIRNEIKSNVPIIALTADVYADKKNEYEVVGINACIVKPFDPIVLCELILKLTDGGKKPI
jgi:CheY-like chemotaxis protein